LFGRLLVSFVFALVSKITSTTNKQLDKLFLICYDNTIDRPDVCSLASASMGCREKPFIEPIDFVRACHVSAIAAKMAFNKFGLNAGFYAHGAR
jgi:hypothetical protein